MKSQVCSKCLILSHDLAKSTSPDLDILARPGHNTVLHPPAGTTPMNGHDRILALLEGRPPDRLPLMPITMMFAGDQAGVPYGQYATDYRAMAEAQILTAEKFDFDYVSGISDPAREAADCGAKVQYFDNQPPAIDEVHALLTDKSVLRGLASPIRSAAAACTTGSGRSRCSPSALAASG